MLGSAKLTTTRQKLDGKSEISRLEFSYPVRLIPAQIQSLLVVAYIVTFGGGMVGGDSIEIKLHLEARSGLLLLSQASTKVYKSRSDGDAGAAQTCSNTLFATIESGALLCLLPEPVTPFKDSAYVQKQDFRIRTSTSESSELGSWEDWGSLLALDWVTSGRMSRGETWQFLNYSSCNAVHVDGVKMLLKDSWHLSRDGAVSIAEKMNSMQSIATVLIVGPQVLYLAQRILDMQAELKKFPRSTQDLNLLWSASPIELPMTWKGNGTIPAQIGAVVRLASTETHLIKTFLDDTLFQGISSLVGDVHLFRN